MGVAYRKPVEIEALIRWAYRDELPKGYRDGKGGAIPAISPMFRYANLGGPVDNWSKEPGFPIAMGTVPHPDALTVHRAILALEPVRLAWPVGAELLLGALMPLLTDAERFAMASLQTSPAALVTMHARLGNRPIWHIDYNIMRVAGRSRKSLLRKGRGRKHLNTQGELRTDVPVSEILAARFEYLAWWAALRDLAATIDLAEHAALPPVAPCAPWRDPGEARVLAAGAMAHRPLPLKPRRPAPLPQLPAARHGRCRHLLLTKPDDAA